MRRAIQCGQEEAFSPLPEQQPGDQDERKIKRTIGVEIYLTNLKKYLKYFHWKYIFRVLVATSFAALLDLLVEKPPSINMNNQFLRINKYAQKAKTPICWCHANVNFFTG